MDFMIIMATKNSCVVANIKVIILILILKNAKKEDTIVFAESYDSNWYANGEKSRPFTTLPNIPFNSFVIQKTGDQILTVSYKPQEIVGHALAITGTSLVVTLLAIVGLFVKKW